MYIRNHTNILDAYKLCIVYPVLVHTLEYTTYIHSTDLSAHSLYLRMVELVLSTKLSTLLKNNPQSQHFHCSDMTLHCCCK